MRMMFGLGLEVRIPRPIFIFLLFLSVFLIAQIGLNQLLLMNPLTIQNKANEASKPMQMSQFENYTSTMQLLMDTGKHKLMKNDGYVNEQMFVRSAFRVSDEEIRLTVLKEFLNFRAIFYEYGNIIGQLSLVCNLPKCLDMFSPKCSVIGYIGQIFNLSASNNQEFLRLRLDKSSHVVKVPIIDVRPKKPSNYEHKLGVCVQPIYMHAEFVVFMQFFEHWLLRGATIFYIYRHSYSKEVQQIFDFYVNNSNATIEFVDWSDLPSNKPDYQPSKYVFRLEVMISIFDCLHRARNKVKYIAQTDLDELVIVKNDSDNLIELMETLSTKYPQMASTSLVSRRAKLPSKFENASSPLEVNFNLFRKIDAEFYYFPRPVYTKLIHRPERVFRGHIHYQTGAELIDTHSSQTYVQFNVPNSKAYILHLRRVIRSNYKLRRFASTHMLHNQAEQWQQNLNHRLKAQRKFPLKEWKNSGLDVLTKIEECRTRHEKRRLKECHTVFDCAQGINITDWYWASNSWTLLY